MLRNIPNKIDQVSRLCSSLFLRFICCKAMLKDIVDETSLGKYDFMYLRIGLWTFSPVIFDFTNLSLKISPTTASMIFIHKFRFSCGYQANICSVGYAFINFEDVS